MKYKKGQLLRHYPNEKFSNMKNRLYVISKVIEGSGYNINLATSEDEDNFVYSTRFIENTDIFGVVNKQGVGW